MPARCRKTSFSKPLVSNRAIIVVADTNKSVKSRRLPTHNSVLERFGLLLTTCVSQSSSTYVPGTNGPKSLPLYPSANPLRRQNVGRIMCFDLPRTWLIISTQERRQCQDVNVTTLNFANIPC